MIGAGASRAGAPPAGPAAPPGARAEARLQRKRDDRGGDVAVDRLLDGPAALAGVGDPALQLREVLAVLLERVRGELEQPRADDGAVVPQVRDRREVERVLARVH